MVYIFGQVRRTATYRQLYRQCLCHALISQHFTVIGYSNSRTMLNPQCRKSCTTPGLHTEFLSFLRNFKFHDLCRSSGAVVNCVQSWCCKPPFQLIKFTKWSVRLLNYLVGSMQVTTFQCQCECYTSQCVKLPHEDRKQNL